MILSQFYNLKIRIRIIGIEFYVRLKRVDTNYQSTNFGSVLINLFVE